MEDILRKNKKVRYNGTKVCKVCGRELLINKFPLKGGRTCKECKNKKKRDLAAQKRIEQYLSDESMHFNTILIQYLSVMHKTTYMKMKMENTLLAVIEKKYMRHMMKCLNSLVIKRKSV